MIDAVTGTRWRGTFSRDKQLENQSGFQERWSWTPAVIKDHPDQFPIPLIKMTDRSQSQQALSQRSSSHCCFSEEKGS